MRKFLTAICGILLLPLAAGLGSSLYQSLVLMQMGDDSLPLLVQFLGGVMCWLLCFLFFPRPVRSYILAHELSHLLAAWLSGVRGGALRVGREEGSVEVEKRTVWIALAPYILPFYSLLLLLLHGLASLRWDPSLWRGFLPFGLGVTWSFHLSFTVSMLCVPQSDVKPYGRFASFVLILCGNLLILCLALFLVNAQPLSADFSLLLGETEESYRVAAAWAGRAWEHVLHLLLQ